MNKIQLAFKIFRELENPFIYTLDWFDLISNKLLLYKIRNVANIYCRSSTTDRQIMNEIFFYKVYERKGFEVKNDDIVLDIGANIGIYSLYIGLKNKKCKIYAFEPDKENLEIAKKNLKINNIKNVTFHHHGLGKENSIRKLYHDGENKGNYSLYYIREENDFKIVNIKPLSLFLKDFDKIDLIKLDCEGAEYEILYSLTDDELLKIKKMVIEYHDVNKVMMLRKFDADFPDDYNGKSLYKFLEKKGYNLFAEFGNKRGTIFASK